MKALPDIKAEAIRLRTEGRLSYPEIKKRLGCSNGSLSLWLRDVQLTPTELKGRRGWNLPPATKKDRGVESKHHVAAKLRVLSREDKAHIAESAVLFRLAIHGFRIFSATFEGDRSDFVVSWRDGQLCKVQVKWASSGRSKCGLPTISICCSNGRNKTRRYLSHEFDVIVGYDLFTDTAYVYTSEDLKDKLASITISPGFAERWDKLCGVPEAAGIAV